MEKLLEVAYLSIKKMLEEGIWKDLRLMYDKAIGDKITQGFDGLRKGIRNVLKYTALNQEQRETLEILESEFKKSYAKMLKLKYSKENIKKAIEPYWKRDYEALKKSYSETVAGFDKVSSSLKIESYNYEGAEYHNYRRLPGVTGDVETGGIKDPAVQGWTVMLSYIYDGKKKTLPKKLPFAYSVREKNNNTTIYKFAIDPKRRDFYDFDSLSKYYESNKNEVLGWYRDYLFGKGNDDKKYTLFKEMSDTIRENALKDLKGAKKSGLGESKISLMEASDSDVWDSELLKLKKLYNDFKIHLNEEYEQAKLNTKRSLKKIHTLFDTKKAGYIEKQTKFQSKKEKSKEKSERGKKFSSDTKTNGGDETTKKKPKGENDNKPAKPQTPDTTAPKKPIKPAETTASEPKRAEPKNPNTTRPSTEKGSDSKQTKEEPKKTEPSKPAEPKPDAPKSEKTPESDGGQPKRRIGYLSKPIDYDKGIFLPPSEEPNDATYFAMDLDTGNFWMPNDDRIVSKLKRGANSDFLKMLNMDKESIKKFNDRDFGKIVRGTSGKLRKDSEGNWQVVPPDPDGDFMDNRPKLRLEGRKAGINEALTFPKDRGTLCPNIFSEDGKMHKDITVMALSFALDAITDGKLSDAGVTPIDIWLTGSLAGYRYRDDSDFDLHIIIDAKPDSIEAMYLKAKAKELNSAEEKLYMAGHPTEVYFQPNDEPHHSNGIYSIYKSEWVKKPTKVEADAKESMDEAIGQMERFIPILERYLDKKDISKFYDELDAEMTLFLKSRKESLDRTGNEFNPRNMAFKMMRAEGIIDGLNSLRRRAKNLNYGNADF